MVTAFHPESDNQFVEHLRQLPEEGHVVPDDPAVAILDVAQGEGAELIVVVGSRSLGGMKRFPRGSVSARVAAHAPMSVLIVYEPGATVSG